jgi:hypothetical protein
MQSTIVTNSYLVNHARTRDQMRYICEALDELKGNADVLSHYSRNPITLVSGKLWW